MHTPMTVPDSVVKEAQKRVQASLDAAKSDPRSGDDEPPSDLHLLTLEETVAELDVAEGTIYGKIKEGRLHPVKYGRRNYFHPDEVRTERERLTLLKRTGRPPRGGVPLPLLPRAVVPPKAPQLAPMAPPRPHPTVLNYDGEVASQAVDLFNADKGVREVVSELKITFELAEHLYNYWKKSGPEFHISPKGLARMRNRFQWFDKATEEGFMRALDGYLDREITRLASEKNLLPKEGDVIPENERALLDAEDDEEKDT